MCGDDQSVGVNSKGCNIGHALTIGFCEEVDTFTVAALDVITAFAVPNVSGFSQSRQFDCRLVALRVAPSGWSLSLVRIGSGLRSQPFRPSTEELHRNRQ